MAHSRRAMVVAIGHLMRPTPFTSRRRSSAALVRRVANVPGVLMLASSSRTSGSGAIGRCWTFDGVDEGWLRAKCKADREFSHNSHRPRYLAVANSFAGF